MAHKLGGDWTSSVINAAGERLADGRFHLVIDEATGTVDPRQSTHEGRQVQSGHAARRDVDRIEIRNHRDSLYRGVLVIDSPGFQMLCGFRTLNAPPLREGQDADAGRGDKSDDKGDSAEATEGADRTQDQVIWVATKP